MLSISTSTNTSNWMKMHIYIFIYVADSLQVSNPVTKAMPIQFTGKNIHKFLIYI